MTLTGELARAALSLRFADLPKSVVQAAQVSLIDGLATMIAASRREPVTRPLHQHALNAGGGPATLLAGGKGQPWAAALANGALAHALDYEDTHDATGLHPNAALIPAALALGEATDASGRDLLAALVAGCEVNCRIGLALGADPAAHGWYHPPMIGMIGASIAAARLLRLTPEQTVSAVSLACCQFALTDELKRSPETDLRAIRDGFAARAAVEAAQLAHAGVSGVALPLEGRRGLFAVLTGTSAAGDLTEDFGSHFHNTEVSIKDWPCCRGTHPFVACALALAEQSLPIGEIAEIGVTVRPPDDMLLEPLADRQAPATPIAARFSIPFTMASALLSGPPSLASFSPDRLTAPAIRELAARIRMDREDVQAAPMVRLRFAEGAEQHLPAPMPPGRAAGETAPEDMATKVADCLSLHPGSDALALIRAVRTLPETTVRQFAGVLPR